MVVTGVMRGSRYADPSAPAIFNNLTLVEDNIDRLSRGSDASGTTPAAGEPFTIPTEDLTETELEELVQASLPERIAADYAQHRSGEPLPGTTTPGGIPPDVFASVLMSPAMDFPLPSSIGFTLREWISTEKIHYESSMRVMARVIKARNVEIANLKQKVVDIEGHGSNENEITRLKARIQELEKELRDKSIDLDNVENSYLDIQEEYNKIKAGEALRQEQWETRDQFHKRMFKAVLREVSYTKELEDRITILNRAIDNQNMLLDKQMSDLSPNDAEIAQMRRTNAGLTRAYESLELQHEVLGQDLHDLQDTNEDLKRKLSHEHALRKELERDHDDLNNNCLIAMSELKTLHAAKQAADLRLKEKDDELKHKAIEVDEIAGWLQKARTELQQATKEISKLQIEVQSTHTMKGELAFIKNQKAQYEAAYLENGDLKFNILAISDDLDRFTLETEQREQALEQEIKKLRRQLQIFQRDPTSNVGGLGIMMAGDGDDPEVSDPHFSIPNSG